MAELWVGGAPSKHRFSISAFSRESSVLAASHRSEVFS
jgi:hypothetical protein